MLYLFHKHLGIEKQSHSKCSVTLGHFQSLKIYLSSFSVKRMVGSGDKMLRKSDGGLCLRGASSLVDETHMNRYSYKKAFKSGI